MSAQRAAPWRGAQASFSVERLDRRDDLDRQLFVARCDACGAGTGDEPVRLFRLLAFLSDHHCVPLTAQAPRNRLRSVR